MASIKIEDFGGVIPREVNDRKLPKNSATRAQDVDLTSGSLVPIGVEAPLQTLHDPDTGLMKGEIPEAEIAAITKPGLVTKSGDIRMCVPNSWLEIEMGVWVTYTDSSDVYQVDNITAMSSRGPTSVEYTDDGFIARFFLSEIKFNMVANYNYIVYGPKFVVTLQQDINYKGGAQDTTSYPDNPLSFNDADVPVFSHPLTYPVDMSGYDAGLGLGIDRYTYGSLELVDYTIPYLEQKLTSDVDVTDYQLAEQGEASFRFRCNYVRSQQVFSLYKQTLVDTADDREGPPSEESQLFAIDPGQILRLNVAEDLTYTQTNLYRSAGGGDDTYGLLEEDAGDSFDTAFDTVTAITTEPLLPYGNHPFLTDELAAQASVMHPANWGCTFFENEVRPSGVFRTWAYPEEYAIALPTNIIAGVVAGNSIIVFTEAGTEEGKVYSLTGNDPEFLSVYKLSDGDPLLNRTSLARIKQQVFWASYDGLLTTNGSGVSRVTEPFFTREEWIDEIPSQMSAYTSENTIWMITPGALNWRLDMDERDKEPFAFLTTFTGFSKKDLIWESKVFGYPSPMAFSHVRILANEYPVGIELFDGNDNKRASYLVTTDQVTRLPRMRTEREWKFRVFGSNTVYSVGLSTNAKEISGDGA